MPTIEFYRGPAVTQIITLPDGTTGFLFDTAFHHYYSIIRLNYPEQFRCRVIKMKDAKKSDIKTYDSQQEFPLYADITSLDMP